MAPGLDRKYFDILYERCRSALYVAFTCWNSESRKFHLLGISIFCESYLFLYGIFSSLVPQRMELYFRINFTSSNPEESSGNLIMSYDQFATTFSQSRKHHPWPELDAIISDIQSEGYTSVLDVGCGNGRFLEEWFKRSEEKQGLN